MALCPSRFNNKTVLLKTLAMFQLKKLALARAFTLCKDGK